MVAAVIIACEIGFWVFVLLGLIVRYIGKRRTLGMALLLMTPLIDVLLLAFTVIDLRGGAEASLFHGLAAVYIGVSLAFGHNMIRWADVRFAYRLASGPAPTKSPKYGKPHAEHERRGWFRHLLACAIGSAVLYVLILLVGDSGKTEPLGQWIRFWGLILLVDFLYSFSFTLWPRRAKSS